jgi:hypothetical protein
MDKNRIIGLALITLSLPMLAMSGYAFYSSVTVHVDGNIAMLRLFSNLECTTPLTNIHFGDIGPGDTITYNFYVKNFASEDATLALDVSNVSPTNLLNYATVSWNREGDNLSGGMSLAATLSMTIFQNVTESSIGAFDYDINVFTVTP